MCYLQECVTIGVTQALECHQCELNPKCLHDLYNGEETYEVT
jgi:uncharacterized protein (UPF0179 family)